MSKCTKCFIDKPPTEFSSYWHSTQKVTRTRKVCNSCYNEQKKQYRLKKKMIAQITIDPEILYKDNPNYRKCKVCATWKPSEQFYNFRSKVWRKCSECERAEYKKDSLEKLVENGGSLKVKPNPNEYNDEYQRANTFELMTLLGYLYNEENGIWYKEPWKTKDGEFPLVKKTRKCKNTKIPKEIKERIIEYRNQNYSIGKISARLNVSETSVWKICQNILK